LLRRAQKLPEPIKSAGREILKIYREILVSIL
jgi:hypothetical protein